MTAGWYSRSVTRHRSTTTTTTTKTTTTAMLLVVLSLSVTSSVVGAPESPRFTSVVPISRSTRTDPTTATPAVRIDGPPPRSPHSTTSAASSSPTTITVRDSGYLPNTEPTARPTRDDDRRPSTSHTARPRDNDDSDGFRRKKFQLISAAQVRTNDASHATLLISNSKWNSFNKTTFC